MKFSYKVILLWTLFICIDITIAAGVAEVWIRAFIPVKNVCYYHDPVLGDMNCPNQKTYGYVEKGYSNILKTNSSGFHDIERTVIKPKGTLRIQIYGDSLIGGIGVPLNKTIPSQTEYFLKKSKIKQPIEVINLSTAEDSTCAEFKAYQVIGEKYSPDIVICFFMDDFEDNIIETHQRTRSPYYIFDKKGALVFVPPIPVDTTTFWETFKRSSLLYRLLANKLLESKFYNNGMNLLYKIKYSLKHQTEKNTNKEDNFLETKNKVLKNKSWPITLRLIQEFNDSVEKNGSRFILIDGKKFHNDLGEGYTNKDLEKFCNKNSIDYISMYSEYSSLFNGGNKSSLVLKDSHPTSLGNKVLSQHLAKKIIKTINHWEIKHE